MIPTLELLVKTLYYITLIFVVDPLGTVCMFIVCIFTHGIIRAFKRLFVTSKVWLFRDYINGEDKNVISWCYKQDKIG